MSQERAKYPMSQKQKDPKTSTSDQAKTRDWRETLFLPKTDFPMRAGLPKREPELLARWADMDLYGKMRADAKRP